MKDIYVDFKSGDIKGDSRDNTHKDTVEVSSFSHLIEQPKSASSSSAGGHAAERVNHLPLVFTKEVDSASPALAVACSSGTVVKDVEIHFYRAYGGNTAAGTQTRKKYLQIRLKNAIVAHVATEVTEEGFPKETFSLKYSAIEWTYDEIKIDGSNGKKLTKQWSLEKNAPVFA